MGHVMKKILFGMLGIASLVTTSALAADLPARAYTKAPVYVEPGYDWTGFYIGGNVGYSWGRSSDASSLTNGAGTVLFSSGGSSNLDGVVGGGQIGYNWQVQNWVWGFEADIQGTDEKGSRGFTCPTGVCTPGTLATGFFAGPTPVLPGAAVPVSLEQKIDWFGTVRGRAGVLVSPKVLLYATGGLAYGEVKSNETIGAFGFSNSDTRVGYTVGAGVEGVIGGNWTAKLEYLYVDLGRTSGSIATTIPAFGAGLVASGLLASSYSSRITDNVLRVGLNYRFGGPVIAKY
jgi:outer membrane immunogenic protein